MAAGMDPPYSSREKRHDAPELPLPKRPFNKHPMQRPIHPPRSSFPIPTRPSLASTLFPQYAPQPALSSPLSSAPGSPLTRSSFVTRRSSTSFHYMSHGSASSLPLSTSLGASSPASATFFADFVSSLEGGDKLATPFDMDAIDLESEDDMQGHIDEQDEKEDGENLDEEVESTTDETNDDTDTDTADSGSSEVDLESEYGNDEDLDHVDGAIDLEDTKARMTLSSSMTLGLFETYRQGAISSHATVATSIIARRSSASSELSVAWSSRDDDGDVSSQMEQETLRTEVTSSPVTAACRTILFETPLLETTTTFESNLPDVEDHGHMSHRVQEDSTREEDYFEDNIKFDEDEDKKDIQTDTADEGAIVVTVQTEHSLDQVSIQAVELTVENTRASTPPLASFICSQEMDIDAVDNDDDDETSIMMTNDIEPDVMITADMSVRPTSPYSVWSYLEEAVKQESESTSMTSTPEPGTVPSSPKTDVKTVRSDSDASSGSDAGTAPFSPVSPPSYIATLEQEMKSKSLMTPIKIAATRPTTTQLVSRTLKSRISSVLTSGFMAASARVSPLTLFSGSAKAVEDDLRDLTQDETTQSTSGSLELEVLRLQAEIAVLHERIDRLENCDGMTPSSNKRSGPGSEDRDKIWTVRGVVVMVLKKGLIHVVLVIVVWAVCYKRQRVLRIATESWRYLKRTQQRWIAQRPRR